jgi:hypothetical protein
VNRGSQYKERGRDDVEDAIDSERCDAALGCGWLATDTWCGGS